MTKKFLVPVQLVQDPTNPLEATTKQYVDARYQQQPKHYVSTDIAGVTPVTSWTQMNYIAPAVYATSGTLTLQASPGGVLLTDAGWYEVDIFLVADRVLSTLYCNIQMAGRHIAFGNYPNAGTGQRFHISSGPFYWGGGANWLTANAQTNTGCWIGGDGAKESRINVVSLF